ncbi:acyl-CoA thioesterase [Streptomyces sp. NPDC001820]|uniref:acyl-CoA thioesterase n=1 Tax=Streptomyces sp. NPDC001820 TaxID=3364613 RepID=UPI00368DDE90
MGIPTVDAEAVVAGVDPSWWSWDGAHGGYAAALALTAVRDRLAARGSEPRPVRTLNAHFLTPVDERPMHFGTDVPRAGRRAAVCAFTGRQGGDAVLTGAAVFGRGGAGPAYDAWPAPAVPGPEDCQPFALPRELAAFARHLEIRPATGARPLGGGERAELTAWIRFADGRPLDAEAVVILSDALPPALFALWTAPRPVPTAELTVHFTDALDTGPATGWALVRIRTEHAGSGWAIDDSAVWSADGRLLALARQARIIQHGGRHDIQDSSEGVRHA